MVEKRGNVKEEYAGEVKDGLGKGGGDSCHTENGKQRSQKTTRGQKRV